jgi:DNA-binding PadR family transcriptional regulator
VVAVEGLTELEGAVLGVLWQRGPCTPYAVRRVFLESPSPYWSGSAGAIYPLMNRLKRQRRIESKASATGRRASKLYSLTPAGARAFRVWLTPPWPAVVTGVPADPLRTRVSFLGALSVSERARFLGDAIDRIAPHLRDQERDLVLQRQAGNSFEEAVARGALAALRARRKWLVETARDLVADKRRRAGRPIRPAR